MNEAGGVDKDYKPPAPPNLMEKFTWLKVTELSALATVIALTCGAAYDAAFFFSFEPHLFGLLSTHDHISSAITFLPGIFLVIFISQVAQPLFTFENRVSVPFILSNLFAKFFPKLNRKLALKVVIRRAAVEVINETTEKFKNSHPEEYKNYLDKELQKYSRIILLCLIINLPIVIILCMFLYAPWSIITVISIFVFVVCFMLIAFIEKRLYLHLNINMILSIFSIVFIIFYSSIHGFLDAIVLPTKHEKNVLIYLNRGVLDDSSVLIRALDGGVLLYNKSLRHVEYYPWREVNRLEVRRRSW